MKKKHSLLGQNIEIRLILNDKTQRELAEYLDFDESHVSRMIRGTKTISAETAFKIADFFGCSVYDLVTPLHDYPAYQDGQASAGAAMHTNEMR